MAFFDGLFIDTVVHRHLANTNSRQMMQNPIMISNIPQWNDQEKFFFFKKEKIKDSIAYWSRKAIGFRYK